MQKAELAEQELVRQLDSRVKLLLCQFTLIEHLMCAVPDSLSDLLFHNVKGLEELLKAFIEISTFLLFCEQKFFSMYVKNA